jgi:hypothetical protein
MLLSTRAEEAQVRSVMNALDEEWSELARSSRACRRLRQWGLQQRALAGHADLQDLLDGRNAGPGAAQAILLGLVRLAPHDELAARVLLQAIMPGLVRLAVTVDNDDPMAREELVAIAWVRIRTYPPTRLGSVAANVLRDVQKYYREHRTIEAPRSPRLRERDEETSPSAEFEAMKPLVMKDVLAARDEGVVSSREFSMILRTRVADTPLDVIATEQAVSRRCVIVRRLRAEQRLRNRLAG